MYSRWGLGYSRRLNRKRVRLKYCKALQKTKTQGSFSVVKWSFPSRRGPSWLELCGACMVELVDLCMRNATDWAVGG